MKKYFLNNGEEIKFGDIVNAVKNEGWKKTTITCTFDKDSIDGLEAKRIAKTRENETDPLIESLDLRNSTPFTFLSAKVVYTPFIINTVNFEAI